MLNRRRQNHYAGRTKSNIMTVRSLSSVVENNEVLNIETSTTTKPGKKIDIVLSVESSVYQIAKTLAERSNVELTGKGEVGTIVLKPKSFVKTKRIAGREDAISVLISENDMDGKSFARKTRSERASAAEKNELPTNTPLQCWKFSGKKTGTPVVVAIFFDKKYQKRVVAIEDLKNNTTAKKDITVNGVKYAIIRDGEGKIVLSV